MQLSKHRRIAGAFSIGMIGLITFIIIISSLPPGLVFEQDDSTTSDQDAPLLKYGMDPAPATHRGGSSHSYRDLLSGYVITIGDVPVDDAKIVLETPRGHRVTYSEEDGYYSIHDIDLHNETSSIKVSKTGFRPYEGEVFIDNRTNFNVTLDEEIVKESVGLIEPVTAVGFLLGIVLTILGYLSIRGDRDSPLLPFSSFPLYTKLGRDKVLTHQRRQDIYRYLEDNPGANYVQIRRELNVGTSSMVHHLRVLEREGFITSRKEIGRRLFFLKGTKLDRFGGAGSRTPSEIQSAILEYMQRNETVTSRSITLDLGLSRSSVLYSLSKLRDRGFIETDRTGNRTYYWIPPEIE